MTEDRRSRDLELLKNAVDRSKSRPRGRQDPNQMLYRGQPVGGRSGRGGRAPGAPGSSGSNRQSSSSGAEVKEALRNLTQLYNDGLITTAEYDAKRGDILDRL